MAQLRARPRVVVLGGGFAGLETAKRLAEADIDLTLIDRENHHCFQPLLYQVATAALSPAEVAWPVRAILRGQANATVLMAEVTGVDRSAQTVHAGGKAIAYDYLVVATGATHSYFGRDEWAAVAPGLKRIEDATRIRRNILLAFERAELTDDPEERIRLLTFVIVGGGPTGVEMAGAISEVARQTLARDFRRIDPSTAGIILVEAGARLLPAFPDDLSAYTRETLERMGVTVRLNTRVTNLDADGADTSEGRIQAATILWAAGVTASPAAAWLGAEPDRAGRVRVTPGLRLPDDPQVFVIGDTASVAAPDGSPVPGIAPAAKQMGRYAAAGILADLGGRTLGPFAYRHAGDLATIGRKAAVVKMGRVKLTGFVGWLVWSLAHVYFLIGLRNRFVVALSWAWTYLTFQRGARLVTLQPDLFTVGRKGEPQSAAPVDEASTLEKLP
ncbi:MAG: FAD-dependent oxidoreductase [Hyphomicrobiales bacterium]|nr:FAD-dependent oxidoreductase [Hyphomicrobiales bacterium]